MNARIWFTAPCALVLALALGLPLPSELLVHPKIPLFELGRVGTGVAIACLLALGLNAPRLGRKWASGIGAVAASYAYSALATVALIVWTEFANRDGRYQDPGGLLLSKPLEHFFSAHEPWTPYGIGLWVGLTPGAIVALAVLAIKFRGRWAEPSRSPRLSSGLLVTALVVFAFDLGTMMAESRFPFADVVVSEVVYPALPAVLLGALLAEVFTPISEEAASPSSVTSQPDKHVSSAFQVSLALAVLIALAVSQTASYADAISELIAARKAFAADVGPLKDDANATIATTTTTTNGVASKVDWRVLTHIPWAEVTLTRRSDNDKEQWRAEVVESLSRERWTLPTHPRTAGRTPETYQIADRLGVKYEREEAPERIFPRIDSQLRARDVAFPGIGLSLQLKSFAIVAPMVVAAMLVVLGFRARCATASKSPVTEPWILVEGGRGPERIVAYGWMACVAAGPWMLGVLLVEVIALSEKSRGYAQNAAADWLASLYAIAMLAALVLSSQSCVRSLLALHRKIANEAAPAIASPARRRTIWRLSARARRALSFGARQSGS